MEKVKQLTAVEWLIEQILEFPLDDTTNAAHLKNHVNKITIFEKAKAMEEDRLKEAVINTFKNVENYATGLTAEEYYNEQFKSE